jgi:hypothetical protein
MASGRFRTGDPFLVASQLWSALHGFVMLELAGYFGHDTAVEQVLIPLLENLVVGLGDEPAATTRSAEAAFRLARRVTARQPHQGAVTGAD